MRDTGSLNRGEVAAYMRAKAKRCRELADIANNLELQRCLDELADEFEAEAAALERRQLHSQP